ncbi:MAG: MoxR family ATPase [Zavarzinella sp.]
MSEESTLSESAPTEMVQLARTVGQVLVGQTHLVQRLLVALLTQGHLLLEGVPGLAKTLAVRTLAQALDLRFQRIQFTPDLLPADIVGTNIYQPKTGEFTIKRGPVFANIILADEINRAPAKVQSALLEAMQERQVTIGDQTFPLPDPFLVLATQNPIEQEGTYPLPEAQIDRFMMKIHLDYPSRAEEMQIVQRLGSIQSPPRVAAVLNATQILENQNKVDGIFVDPKIEQYIVDIVQHTRPHQSEMVRNLIQFGASPRASLALVRASKAMAFLQGRKYVIPQDVKDCAADVLRHRLVLTYEAQAEEQTADQLLQKILDFLPIP